MVDLEQLTKKILADTHYETNIEPKLSQEQSSSLKVMIWYLTAETYNEGLVKKALEVANRYDAQPMMLVTNLWERIFAYNKGRPDLQWKVVESFDNRTLIQHMNSLKIEDKDWKYLTRMATEMVLGGSDSNPVKNDYVIQQLQRTLFNIAYWGGFSEKKNLIEPSIEEWCNFAKFIEQYKKNS